MTRPLFGISAPPSARYQARHAALLAAGRHPLTLAPLRTDGTRCGDCVSCVQRGMVAGRYLQCRQAPITAGPATDVKARWPACVLFAPRVEGVT